MPSLIYILASWGDIHYQEVFIITYSRHPSDAIWSKTSSVRATSTFNEPAILFTSLIGGPSSGKSTGMKLLQTLLLILKSRCPIKQQACLSHFFFIIFFKLHELTYVICFFSKISMLVCREFQDGHFGTFPRSFGLKMTEIFEFYWKSA
jgi:hypothetical protein